MNPEHPTITVHRSEAYVPLSLALLVDSGAISEDEAIAQGWTPSTCAVVAHPSPLALAGMA